MTVADRPAECETTVAMLAEADRIQALPIQQQRAAFDRLEQAQGRHMAEAVRFIVYARSKKLS